MKNNWGIALFLLLSAVVLLVNVGSFGVVESSDARYAEIAREMYVSGDYLHPNLLDVHHYHKPPFTYQITTLGYSIFGINAFGARFFLQIAVLFQLLLVYALTFLLFNSKKTALWASIIYFSFPIVLIASRNLTTDAFLATFVLLSMYAWVKYRKSEIVGFLYLFSMALALGFLTKGPVVLLVPMVFILAYNRNEKLKLKLNIHHLLAGLLFLSVALSWFIYLGIENSAFFDYFIGKQTIDRFSVNAFNRTEPFWYFLAFAPLVGLPWLLVLPYLIRQNKKLFSENLIYKTLLIGILIPLLFFSISSSKRILYILPLYSLISILSAQLLTVLKKEKAKKISQAILGYLCLLFSAFIVTLFIKTDFIFPKELGIVSIILLPLAIYFYRNNKIDRKVKSIYLSLLGAVFLLLGSGVFMSANELEIKSSKPVTDFILDEHLEKRAILVYNTRKPSIAFGLNQSIVSLSNGDDGLKRETQFEQASTWKKYLINMKDEAEINELKEILKMPSVLIVHDKRKLAENHQWLLSYYQNEKIMKRWTIYY